MTRISKDKMIIENEEYVKRKPNYWKFVKEQYALKLKKYQAITDKGLNIDAYIDIINKAAYIATILGQKTKYSCGNYEYLYDNNNLRIILKDNVIIFYNGELMLDEKNYNPGEWEQIIDNTYEKRNELVNQKRHKHISGEIITLIATKYIKENSEIIINNSIVIKRFDYYDKKHEFINEGIIVIENGRTVYLDSRKGYNYPGINLQRKTIYIPGQWEDIINKYLNQAELYELDKYRIRER